MPLQSFRVATQPKKPGQLTSLTVDQTKSWAFFDGACQRPQKNCGLGFCIFFNPTHFITGKANIGKGTNNIVELSAILALLKIAAQKGIQRCHIYGDSNLCIGWMNEETQLIQMNLHQLGTKVWTTARTFQELHFTHIFWESNMLADSLSKEALQLMENALIWEERSEGNLIAWTEGTFL